MSMKKLHNASRVMPECSLDSVAESKKNACSQRAFDVLLEAQQYWLAMERFREDRERNKKYTYGKEKRSGSISSLDPFFFRVGRISLIYIGKKLLDLFIGLPTYSRW